MWALIGLTSIMVLSLSCWLEPDPRGFGTHVQLGLPACAFEAWTGLRCPSCGLTTSFAHMARWQLTSSVRAHALGPPLFLLTIAALAVSLVAGARAWPVAVVLRRLRAPALAAIIAVSALACWIARSLSSIG